MIKSFLMEKLQLNIIQNGMNGEGVAKSNGKVFFVSDAVVGDVIVANVVKENKNFNIAKLEEILEPSEHRCIPPCPYYGKCGGCNLQHIKYEKQLDIKTENVQNLFDKNKLNFNIKNCVSSPNKFEYRNKLTLYLSKNNNLGFYQKNTKNIIEINSCCLVDEKFNNLINKLNVFFKNNIEFNSFVLKGIAIRQISDLFIINLILNKKIILTKLEQFLKLNKINYSLFYCINNKNNLPVYPCIFVGGIDKVVTEEFDIKYNVEPMSFLQVNNQVKTIIYKNILEHIKGYNNILDAYSGAGLLSAILAKNAKSVYAIELDKSACESCKNLCKTNNIKNLKCICGDCTIEIPELLTKTKIDCIVLDPARKGVDIFALEAIKNAKPKEIIYLSCNPATLTRDLKVLCENNEYKIFSGQAFDMFPQTSEVETLVFLKKQ